jgi:putative Holliday junction resolvase
MARYLAIDLGDKRTGLAVADSVLRLPMPLEVVQATTHELVRDAVLRAIESHDPTDLVVGMPFNMDGSEGPRARIVRAFVESLRQRTDLPVHLQDERCSSLDAEEFLQRSGRTHGQKKAIRDALAACVILQGFLDAEGG